MAGRRGPPGPPLAPGLPSRPLGGQRDREDDHRGGDGRGAFMRGGGIDVRYERGNGPAFRQGDRDYPMRPAARDDRDGAGRLPPPHRDYGNDWGRERDDRRGPSHPRGSRWQRERTRSPPPRGDRWGGGRPTRERSPDPLEARMERSAQHPPLRRPSPSLGARMRSPSPSGPSSHYSRQQYPAQGRDSGYPPRADRERDRNWPRDSASSHFDRERDYAHERDHMRPRGGSRSPELGRSDIRRGETRGSSPSSTTSRRDRSSPTQDRRPTPPLPQGGPLERSAQPSSTSVAGPSRGKSSFSPNVNPSLNQSGPPATIPTGPKASFAPRGRGRGDMAGAALGRRGGIPVRGGSHVRGGGPPGMPANGYMASSRGRGGSMAWGGRGRGGGGVGGFGGAPSGVDDPPPRSLARKVDAGGNAVMPDLIAVPSASEGGVDPSRSQTVGEEPEEGEREEGEMDETAPEEQGELGQPEAPDETAYPQAAPTGSIHPTQRPLHLGSLPGRQSYSQQAPSESGGASDSATPLTPAMPATTTPSISSAVGQNPYSSAAWQNPATSTPNPTQTPARSAAPKTVPTYTAAHFSKSVQPEWDAELWTLSAHRLAAISQHPISTNFHVSLQDPPTTPGLSGVPPSIVSGLRTALADLKEATTELEMSSIRSRECERSRAEAAQM